LHVVFFKYPFKWIASHISANKAGHREKGEWPFTKVLNHRYDW